MRYRLPEGCAGVVLGGRTLVTSDGVIEADVAAAAELAPHGIVPDATKVSAPEDRAKPKRLRS